MRSLIAAIAETENRIAERYRETEKRIAELRAQQANINQNTDSQEKTESKEQHEKTDSQDKTDSEEQHDTDMNKPEPETSPKYYEPADTNQKKPGESRASHEPPQPRIRIKICKGGEGGNHHRGDGHHRGTITVKSALETEGLTSQEELVLPPFKEERQIRIADDLDSGQEPPSVREEPAMCGLLTMRGLLAEQLFTVHEPFTTNGLDGGQEPPSSKEEQQGGTGRDIDIGDIDSTHFSHCRYRGCRNRGTIFLLRDYASGREKRFHNNSSLLSFASLRPRRLE